MTGSGVHASQRAEAWQARAVVASTADNLIVSMSRVTSTVFLLRISAFSVCKKEKGIRKEEKEPEASGVQRQQ